MKINLSIAAVALAALIIGCAHLSPGADPLVVRVEQTQASASSTFDLVLHEDQANRSFWMTNAPAYHNFCEWLRAPMQYNATTVPRALVMQLQLDDLKTVYKTSKNTASSNALYSAEAVLITALGQAGSWINIATNSFH